MSGTVQKALAQYGKLHAQDADLDQANFPTVAVVPVMRKGIARAQRVARRKEKKRRADTVGDVKLVERIHHRPRAMLVGRDGEHAKSLPAEMPLMQFAGVRGQIRAHLALEACLQNIAAGYGHCATINLDHEASAGAVGIFQTERKIWDKPDLMHGSVVRDAHAER